MVKYLYGMLLLIFYFNSYAIETIVINRGHIEPTSIAINKFDTDSDENAMIGDDIISVISNDLKNSGMFWPFSTDSFAEQSIGIKHKPVFTAWRQINVNLLIHGEVIKLSFDRLRVSFILWDINLEKNLIEEVFEIPIHLWRRVAHKIADKIYEKITGDSGYFDTRITYVSESGSYLKRIKRIAIMDYDGANHKYLSDGKNLVLTPRFSPQTDKIMYLSYTHKQKPNLYIHDLKTGKKQLVGNFCGMSFAPRFSPQGHKVVMSIAKRGATHIFEIDLNSMRIKQLTQGIGINTSPSYSPDGSKIVFNSDRSGSRQLYIMNSDGSHVKRISFGDGVYATPSWSPKGDYIAFTKVSGGEIFAIGIMKAFAYSDENVERIITSGYLVEGPCWSPNGRLIIFAKGWPPKNQMISKNRIYSIDLISYNEREIITPQDASDPEWSKILN